MFWANSYFEVLLLGDFFSIQKLVIKILFTKKSIDNHMLSTGVYWH
jgi:hypothetical protein